MDQLSMIQIVAVAALPVILAITVHEAAHGWVAMLLGDKTAMMLGRVTLNPIKHIDPFGTIVLPTLLILMNTGFIFAWAKPVPITWGNLKRPKRDISLVAVAGPAANLLMAFFWVMIVWLGSKIDVEWLALPMIYMGQAGVLVNAILCVLNLLPLPPLDGGRILTGLLPGPWAWQVGRIEPYGLIILIGLMVFGWLGQIILPPIFALQSFLYHLMGIPF